MGLAGSRRGRLQPHVVNFACTVLPCTFCCVLLLVFFIDPILILSKRLGTVNPKRVWIDRCRARPFFLKNKKWTERLQLPRDLVFVVRSVRVISNVLSVAPRDSVFVVLLKSEHWTE